MKTLTFNTKSWHRWIADFGMDYGSRPRSNICEYTRSFLLGLFWLLVVVSVVCVFTIGMISFAADFFAWLAWMAINLAWIPPWIGSVVVLAVFGIILTLLLLWGLKELYLYLAWRVRVKATQLAKEHPDSFVVAASISIKDKWCAKLEWQGEDNS